MDLLAFSFQGLAVHVLQERGNLLLVERGKLFLERGVVGTSLLGFAVHFLLDGVEGGVELVVEKIERWLKLERFLLLLLNTEIDLLLLRFCLNFGFRRVYFVRLPLKRHRQLNLFLCHSSLSSDQERRCFLNHLRFVAGLRLLALILLSHALQLPLLR